MSMMEIQTKLAAVIIQAATHHIDPHRSLSINMVPNTTYCSEHAAKPFLIIERTLIECMHDIDDAILAKH